MTALRILIGCETSGVMRRAFAAAPSRAWPQHVQHNGGE